MQPFAYRRRCERCNRAAVQQEQVRKYLQDRFLVLFTLDSDGAALPRLLVDHRQHAQRCVDRGCPRARQARRSETVSVRCTWQTGCRRRSGGSGQCRQPPSRSSTIVPAAPKRRSLFRQRTSTTTAGLRWTSIGWPWSPHTRAKPFVSNLYADSRPPMSLP